MARSKGKVDLKQLKALEERFHKLNKAEIERFNEELVKEKVKYFLSSVIRLTIVGDYDDGRVGGTLRRGWTTKSQREAELSVTFGGVESVDKHINENLIVNKKGKKYSIDVANNVEYASYVNFGHRTKNGGFVNGKFFQQKAEQQTILKSNKLLERKLVKLLKEAVDGD